MTASTHHGTLNSAAYSPQQAFARDVLIAAVNGGIRHWACVYGYQWDVPPGQVHAEGVDDRDGGSRWRVDLDDIQRALDTLTDDADLCWPAIETGDRTRRDELSTMLRAIRAELAANGYPLPAAYARRIGGRLGDIVVQIAVADEVIYQCPTPSAGQTTLGAAEPC